MAKSARNKGNPWTKADLKEIRRLVKQNTPTRVIASKLGRTPGSLYMRASTEGISLKPTKRPTSKARKNLK